MGNTLPEILTFNAKFSIMGKTFIENHNILLGKIVNEGYDIIAIQECTQSFRDKASKQEGYNTCYFHGNLIMSKWDLKEIVKHKNYIICETQYNNVNINICSVHLPSTCKKSEKRLNLFDSLMNDINQSNSIIMGDFNMSSDEYAQLCRKYPGLLMSTELNTYGNQFPYDRIILNGKNIKFINSVYASDMKTRSDHLALSTSISIENNAQGCYIM